MTTNKGLRVFAAAALGLSLFSANTFALPPVEEPAVSHTLFQILGRVEDSISVTGLSDVEIDFDNKNPQEEYVTFDQKFTIERNGATADAPGLFSITAKSQYGASAAAPGFHVTKNQRGDVLPVDISYWGYGSPTGERLEHGNPLTNRQTTGDLDEHTLGVGFYKEHLENAKPGLYNTNVTLTIAAE